MRLSSPIEEIKDHYEVVVIGSGYGGSIAASRMARAGQQVCILERGKELQPGEYPDTLAKATKEFQVDLPEKHIGSETGLFNFHVNKDVNALVGCGLGGTSLINANVSLEAELNVLESPEWPEAFRADINTKVKVGYQRAREMLKPSPYPESYPHVPKLKALETSASVLSGNFYRPPINVNFEKFENGVNHVGVEQEPCNGCGDCVSGCNYKAKNTVLMNYLPDAKNFGAEIFTETSVKWIERENNRWLIHYEILGLGREKFDAPDLIVSADIVFVSAGTLGSTEILLRSAQKGLSMSNELGNHFSNNGDVLAFGYNCDEEINGIGFGDRSPQGREQVGPCITGIIDRRLTSENPDQALVIEEGSIPGAIGSLLPIALTDVAATVGVNTVGGIKNVLQQQWRQLVSLFRGPYKGAVRNTQTYLVMSYDSDKGKMLLDPKSDRLRIDWPGAGSQPILQFISNLLQAATVPLKGNYLRNPIWTKLFGHDLITVHPLGGCIMGEDAAKGVVNHKGQVFAGTEGTEVHEGLYVSDGSVVPRVLEVNPLLTISAITERSCAILAEEKGWTINYDLPSSPSKVTSPTKIGIEFTETMKGYFSNQVKTQDGYQQGYDQGRQNNSPFEFTLSVISENLDEMLKNPQHQAAMIGTVIAPALSPDPLTVNQGVFNLFTIDPNIVGARQMRYSMIMDAESGQQYYMYGYKEIKDDSVLDIWRDTTTLYITVHEGKDSNSPVLGKGILKIAPEDFAKQLTTMEVKNAPNKEVELKSLAKFGEFFAGALFQVYGGIFAKSTVFNPDAPPRKKRKLRVSAPEIYPFTTKDGVDLRLTRYRPEKIDEKKLPVMLCHGLGVSSLIFSMDTIETNMLEYLYAEGYDVWLLDFRSSIALPKDAVLESSGDVIAENDFPAAIDVVRQATGKNQIDAVVHCYGSTTFFMSMLKGLQGVRSIFCSQIATHMKVPFMTGLKAGLHLPRVLDDLGFKSLTADVTPDEGWWAKVFDKALKFYPVDAGPDDTNPVSRRISFLYGQLYEIEQLNTATYDALHEMFGVAAIAAFEHLTKTIRKGHLVTFQDENTYLTDANWKNLGIPITIIHGAKNQCWLPESTEITYKLLQQYNPGTRYVRHVIPAYGHIDCIFGKNASRDVYPYLLQHLKSLENG